jgi:predicted peroxiredoxin
MNGILKIIYLSIIFTLINSILFTNNFKSNIVYSEPLSKNITNKTKLVYHLSSDDPWRATVALSDSQTMLSKGFNVTLMLSIEGVQLGVKHSHQFLGLDLLTNNVTNFINKGGNLIICEVCLKIAGYNNSDIIDKAVIGTPQIMANLLNKTTVVDY